ncbi:pilus assembly protein CpaE [Jatrophihabitans sp. YIM 134969]
MITLELARALRDAGLRWVPTAGDRFTVVDRDMDADVFVLADMTVEVHRPPTAGGDTVIGFNGTTEWALDSVDQTDAVWLPAEDQLRERLGEAFRRLDRRADGTWAVTHLAAGDEAVSTADSAADAYARAVLTTLTGGSQP